MASTFARRRRENMMNNSSSSHVRFNEQRIHDSDSSSDDEEEDEETRLRREEERLDQALSDRFGEAAEAAPARGEKRPQTEEEIAAEYEQKKKKRQKRPKLTIPKLTGVDGLIRLPTEFKAIRYRNETNKKNIKAAASYSLNLIEAYKSFCYDLMPSMAFEDVLINIQKLGSKREVKSYLENMRHDIVRNKYVEKLYGREKAEKMIQELEMGLRQQDDFHAMDEFDDLGGVVSRPPLPERSAALQDTAARQAATGSQSQPMTRQQTNEAATMQLAHNKPSHEEATKDDGEENELTFDEAEKRGQVAQQPSSNNVGGDSPRKGPVDDDDDDAMLAEMEAADENISIKEKMTKLRRQILDDSSDDDEEEGAGLEDSTESDKNKPPVDDNVVNDDKVFKGHENMNTDDTALREEPRGDHKEVTVKDPGNNDDMTSPTNGNGDDASKKDAGSNLDDASHEKDARENAIVRGEETAANNNDDASDRLGRMDLAQSQLTPLTSTSEEAATTQAGSQTDETATIVPTLTAGSQLESSTSDDSEHE